MSLHKFAEQVASQGRGDDSLLVHMTPDEVRNLQRFAQANGTTLTINPVTGLPEAGLLSDLFKAVAPIALGAFLGPAGLGMSSMMAGVATGGITTLATGSLSRGLMAGLGAYGGAGLGESFMTAGGNAMVSGGAPVGAENLVGGLSSSGATAGSAVSVPPIEQINPSNFNLAKPDVLSAGAKAAAANPMAFAKQNLGNLAYAAAPIAAGLMVPTTTKLPDPKDTGRIRQMAFNINPDTGRPDPLYGMREMPVVKTSDFGDKTFKGQRDLFYQQNPNPYDIGIGSLNQPPQQQQQPTPMAGGGIVALAGGGDIPGYAGNQGSLVSDADIFKYFQTPGLSDAKIAQDMQTFGVSAADIARATGTQNQQADYEKRFVNTLLTPTTDSSEFLKATGAVGLKDQSLATAMQNAGLSQGAQYALTHAIDDKGYTGGIVDASTGKPVDFYNQIGYTAGALPGDQGGLEGLYGNINYGASGLQNLINSGKMTVAEAQNAALAELERAKLSLKDVEAATGKKFGDLFTAKKKEDDKKTVITDTDGTGVVTGGTGTGTGVTTVTPTPFTSVIPGGFYGNATNPGDITTNKDGTVTVHPNIPYRPYGGFSGMGEVRDAYTKGGGSLGYTAPIPKDPEASFNKMTDDSLDAYNFLMGKGKNLAQVNAARSRPLMQPYFTGSNRYKPKFLSYDKDGQVVSSATSGKQGDAKVADLTKAKTIEVVDSSGYNTETYTAVLQDDGTYLAGNGKRYDVTGKQIAAGGGMTGYAMGGGLGSLGSYSDGGRLLRGPGDGVSDSIPATIGAKQQPARLADGEFVIPARIVSELGNGSTDAGAKKLYAMMDRVQRARGKTTGKNKVAANSRADKHLPA